MAVAGTDGLCPHVEPRGVVAVLRHYLRDLVYGANDGLITTFAVVAGVQGGALSQRAVLVIGAANLVADGVSMAVGNYLSIRSNESVRRALSLPEEEPRPARHAVATFVAFAAAGAVPLVPYLVPAIPTGGRATAATAATLATLFGVGAMRAGVTNDRWLASGLEMLVLGAVTAALAYYAGVGAAWVAAGVS
jgi:vacuolar iron transporter family protein